MRTLDGNGAAACPPRRVAELFSLVAISDARLKPAGGQLHPTAHIWPEM